MLKNKSLFIQIGFFYLLFLTGFPVDAAQEKTVAAVEEAVTLSEDNHNKYSTFSSSLGAPKSYGESVVKSIIHKNLMIDDAREDPLAEVQQKDELIQTNQISVLNSLGGSKDSHFYTADQLPNKFGGDITKEGLIEVPEGKNAVIAETDSEAGSLKKSNTESSKPQNQAARVLVA